MKKLLLTTMVLASTVAVAACTGKSSEDGLDGGLTNAPYTEERTIATNNTGSTTNNTGSSVATTNHGHSHDNHHGHHHGHATHSGTTTIQSAEPVFQRGLVK
jgi:hypothetical protein